MSWRHLVSNARRNFALRIYLFLAGSLALFAAVLTGVSVHVQRRMLADQIRRDGATLAALLADGVRVGVFSENDELLSAAVDVAIGRHDVRRIWVFNAQKKLLQYRSRPLSAGYTFWEPVRSRAAYASDEALDLSNAPQPSVVLGQVAVELSDAPLREGRRVILARSVAVALGFLALAAFATALVVREATRPLRVLLADVGRHGLPVPAAADGDDLGMLRDTFGRLVGSLNGAFDRIADLTAGLERTVEERTGELRQANAELARARDELEERVRERTAELEHTHSQLLHAEKLSAVGRLSASIAHEFNNPIFAIRSVLQSVQKVEALPAEEAETVALAIAECNRVASFIRGLQSFNRPSQGVMGPVDLHHALDALLLLCRRELSGKNATVVLAYASGRLFVWGVEDQLKQVFLNLLTNAMDALPAKGGTIRIATEAENGMVSVRVADTGSGILAEHLPHVFEPFFTTKPEVKGTGLGLSVSFGIVQGHGGTLEVESRPGEGSTFTVRLPVEGTQS